MDFAALRRREFSRLDATGSAYLDYTGSALYPESLVRRDGRRLLRGVLGNPHSESAPSLASTEAMEEARAPDAAVLRRRSRATTTWCSPPTPAAAIRILAEAFPFRHGSRLVVTADNHNSVNGLRVPARGARRRRRATCRSTPACARAIRACGCRCATAPSLFAFPAQSNFSGVRHPLDWVQEAQARGYHVLLDAAAYAADQPRCRWRRSPADFVAISFYKMFGYPTGVGALLVRRQALAALERGYFGGGTVQIVSVQNDVVRVAGRQRRRSRTARRTSWRCRPCATACAG